MKAKFYIQTKDGDRTFYERKPENLHVTDALTVWLCAERRVTEFCI